MTKTFYAVFDTNVLVSALMSRRADSPTVALLDYVLDGRIVLLFNEGNTSPRVQSSLLLPK